MNDKIIQHSRKLIGLYFKNLRKEKGLSQKQIAALCGATQATISMFERGKSGYSINLLFKLGEILEFTINLEQKENGLSNRFLLHESEKTGTF